tara:strand:+ start:44 stop:487 length:444 start_codon:yes stop_codon:yes gene_type:complete
MTSQLNVDAIVDKAGSGGTNVKIGNTSTYVSDGGAVTQNTVQGIAKAWCRWEMSGTAAIENSFNITSLTDDGTGQSTLTIANDFSDIKYSATIGVGEIAGGGNRQLGIRGSGGKTLTAGTISFFHMDLGSNAQDIDLNNVTLHGDLA